MSIHPSVTAALEEIDAQMFTGDPYETKERYELLRFYVDRWVSRLEEPYPAHAKDMLFENIDFEALRQQKEWLMARGGHFAEGLIGLIDGVQDTAVDSGFSEEDVFGKEFTDDSTDPATEA